MKEIAALVVLLIFAWSTIYFEFSIVYTIALLAFIYAAWVLTPPYPDMELLVTPIFVMLLSYLILKSPGGKKMSKRRVVLASTIISVILVYTTALLILYLTVTMFGITNFFGIDMSAILGAIGLGG